MNEATSRYISKWCGACGVWRRRVVRLWALDFHHRVVYLTW